MRYLLALWICKFTTWVLRTLNRGGTALPGKLALKVCPDILTSLAKDFDVYVVSGTNGKTTTALLMSAVLDGQGIPYISNRSGSNLERGIVACFAEGVTAMGKPKGPTHAVIECDEAAFAKVADKLNPKVLVVTNFFKDQLDRYGEVTHTLELVKTGASKAKEAIFVLNGDDQLCASIGADLPNKAIYYGMDNSTAKVKDGGNSEVEAGYCIKCQSKLEYAFTSYGHLGKFHCPACGYARPELQVEMDFYKLNIDSAEFAYAIGESRHNCTIKVSGLYNVYNAMGAIGFGEALGFDRDQVSASLESSNPGFGRMETVHIGNKAVRTVLVKNPMGYNQVINYLLEVKQPLRICFALNDNIADGVDISWLWDVNFENLEKLGDDLKGMYTCGMRGADVAVRLKYAGLEVEYQETPKSVAEVMNQILEQMEDGETLLVLPSYTAMFEVRSFLQDKIKMKEFWN